jgi:exportin-5
MRDTRANNLTILAFNRVLPFFRRPGEARDYIVDAVLKAAISSFNEDYFADCQTKLAGLIAQVISLDEPTTRAVIVSLPGLDQGKVDRRLERLRNARSTHQGAAVVLEMLQGLRGVSIHELGRMGGVQRKKKGKSAVEEMGMAGIVNDGIQRGGEEQLDGVAGMFG